MQTKWYRTWIAAGASTALVVMIVRLVTSRGRDEFSLWPDEPAQLAMARFIGGGVPWSMHDHSTWQPGYATLISPVHWFTDDPVTVLHTALAVNAVLGGLAAWLLVLLVRRLTTLGPWTAAAIAALVALAPAALFTTEFVWSESLVAVLFPATLLALLRFGDTPTIGRGVVAGGSAALAFATHSRMLPLAVVTIGLAVALAVQRRMHPRAALAVIGSTAVAMVLVRLYAGFVFDRLWDTPSTTNSLGGVIDHIGAPGTILIALAGQAWYLLVTTAGIVLYGTVALVRAVRPPPSPVPPERPVRRDAIVVLVVAGCCVAVSVLFMAGRMRPDQIVYGRYNDTVVAPLLIAGFAVLLTETAVRRMVAIVSAAVLLAAGCAAVLAAWRRDALDAGSGLEPMILGLQPFVAGADRIDLARITVTGIAVMVAVNAVALAARRVHRPALTLVAVAALVVVGSARTSDAIDAGWRGRGDLSAVGLLADDALAGGVDVEFLLADGVSSDRLVLYQMYLPTNRFTVIERLADGGRTAFVFAPLDDRQLRDTATLVWSDPRRNYGLWER